MEISGKFYKTLELAVLSLMILERKIFPGGVFHFHECDGTRSEIRIRAGNRKSDGGCVSRRDGVGARLLEVPLEDLPRGVARGVRIV